MAWLRNGLDNTPPRRLSLNDRRFVDILSKPLLLTATVVLVALLGTVDVLTGPEISLSVFYLLPICLATWRIGGWTGVLMSALSAVTWRLADALAGQTYSHPVIPYWNMLVRLSFFLVTTFLLSELKKRLEWEKDSARTDPLTKIANRRHFYALAQMQIARAVRYGEPFTVAYVDIDNFKAFNDRFGHGTGDTLLSLAAGTIQTNIRAVDVVARMGGDEFVILLSNSRRESAQEALHRVRTQLSHMVSERGWPVTFSMGAVTFVRPPDSVDEMIATADDLMYAAKRDGKGILSHQV